MTPQDYYDRLRQAANLLPDSPLDEWPDAQYGGVAWHYYESARNALRSAISCLPVWVHLIDESTGGPITNQGVTST
jgi:hypothetical protein